MKGLIVVAAGGAVGSVARYLVWMGAVRFLGIALVGTLAVNLVGSFAIAVLSQAVSAQAVSEQTRLAVGVGVLGGFTTYSSFNNEAVALAQAGNFALATTYTLGTVLGCLAAGALGLWAGRAWMH